MDTTYMFARNSAELCNGMESTEALHIGATNPGLPRVQSIGSSVSHSFASAVAAHLSRSRTPEPQLIGRSLSPGLPPVGNRVCTVEKNIVGLNSPNSLSSSMTELADIAASLSGLNLSKIQLSHEDCLVQSQLPMRFDKHNHLLDMSNGHKQNLHQIFIDKSKAEKLTIPASSVDLTRKNGIVTEHNASKLGFDGQMNFPQASSANLYSRMNPSSFSRIHTTWFTLPF